MTQTIQKIKFEKPIKQKKKLISIIIPIYNEEKTIARVLKRIPNHHPIEILIIDDGSTDNSINKIDRVQEKNIKIISHAKNKGYGSSILTGFEHASGDILVTIDSDGQHRPQEIHRLVEPIINDEADLVVGSRYLGECQYQVPLHTKAGEFMIKVILKILFGQPVGNNQSGFRAFRRKDITNFNNLIYTNFGLCTEILFKAALSGLRIKEVQVTIKKREHGTSRVKLYRIALSIFSCLFIYTLKRFKALRFVPNSIINALKRSNL